MPDVPTTLPTDLIAGNTWQWDRDYGDYPQSTWIATAFFENAKKTFNVAATANGTAQRFTIDAATTATYPAGRYRVRVRVTDGSQVFIAESGWCDVEVDPAAAGVFDPRSWEQRTIDAIKAFLEGSATTMQASMTIGGRSIARWPRDQLYVELEKLEARVRSAESASNGGRGRNIKVRFGRV